MLSYTLSDVLGSVSESVNASTGAVTATQLYTPYGSVRYSSGTLPTSYGYTHQRSDATSGLDYYGARYYDPLAGEFTSADTMLAGGLNRYAYVGGNPETVTDPSGHCPWCIAALVGAVVGAGIAYGSQVAANVANGGSLTDGSTWTNVSWGQVIMGGVAGGLIGLTGGLVGAGIAASGAGLLGEAGAEVTGRIVAGGIEGGLNQIAGNVMHGRQWSHGVLQATGMGLASAGFIDGGGAVLRKLAGSAETAVAEGATDAGSSL